MRVLKMALVAVLLGAGPAMAADIVGTWERDNGASRVRMSTCGGQAVCGVVSWLRDPATANSKVGQRVFYDMKPDGDGWTGSRFQPGRRQDVHRQGDRVGQQHDHQGLRVRRPVLQVGKLDARGLTGALLKQKPGAKRRLEDHAVDPARQYLATTGTAAPPPKR